MSDVGSGRRGTRSTSAWNMAALPPRKTSTPGRGARQTLNSLQILLQMGFPRNRAEKALATTGERGVQLASDWLLAHVNDSELDAAVPREYVLYLCPKGALLEELQKFFRNCFQECGWNRAMNQVPHITVCPFFPSPDADLLKITEALQEVLQGAQSRFPVKIPLELYISSNFMGLFVPRDVTDFLRGIGADYFKAIGQKRPLSLDEGCEDLHLTLAYQFPSPVYAKLEKLARGIDLQVGLDSWEFRLYSREHRAIGRNVYRVLYSHVPIENDELELLIGDFVYVKADDLASSPDGWVQGTSWLTGCSGCLPNNYIERTAESDAWTLHKVFPMCRSSRLGSLERREDAGFRDRVSPSLCRRLSSHEHHGGGSGAAARGKPEVRSDPDPDPDQDPRPQSGPAPASEPGVPASFPLSRLPGCEGNGRQIAPEELPPPARPRHIIVVRHGERVDFTFGTWIPYVFQEDGKYTRRDTNMPAELPERVRTGPNGYFRDGPLTRVGLLQAFSIGEGLRAANVTLHHVFCSPSYRCIQTCDALLRGLGYRDAVKINVEPGLFEWLFWHQDTLPDCFTPQELKDMGFNINLNYKPFVTEDELKDNAETCTQFYMRNFYVAQSAANVTASQGGNILMIAHAASLDTCLRQLTGLAPRTPQELTRVIHRIPYCSMSVVRETCVAAEQVKDAANPDPVPGPASAAGPGAIVSADEDAPAGGKGVVPDADDVSGGGPAVKRQWQLVEPFSAPFTNSSNMRYDWKILLT